MGISILTVLLFILVTPIITDYTIFHDQQPTLYYGLVFLMLILLAIFDLLKGKYRILMRLRIFAVFLIIILTVGLGSFIYVYDRHKISPSYRTNDIVIQQEVAVRMLLTGKNPYKETYKNTALEEFKFYDAKENPALYHFVMEPFYLVSVIPFYFTQSRLFGFFDARVPLYFLFFAMLTLGYKVIKDKENKLLFITLMTFNPMTLRFVLEGRSDMFMYPFLFVGFILLHKRHFSLATVFTALAFAIKQSAWPFFPLFTFFIYIKTKSIKQVFKYTGLMGLVSGMFILPFFLRDPNAFLNSTVYYLTGATLHSYPISGYGFSMVLRNIGTIRDTSDYYPFIIWQIIFLLPALFLLFKLIKKYPTTKTLISSYALLLFVFWYFSRYFNDSHIGFISSIIITAYFWPEKDART